MARVIRGRGQVASSDAEGEDPRTREGADERERAQAELAAAHLDVERARRALLEGAEATIASLAMAVAERVIGEALEARPEHVRAVVREGLERVRRASRVRVRVHPSDAAQLIELEAEVVEDPSITRGGCVVESELGEVDARLEVRLDALARAIGAR